MTATQPRYPSSPPPAPAQAGGQDRRQLAHDDRPQGHRLALPDHVVHVLHRRRDHGRCSCAPSWPGPGLQFLSNEQYNQLFTMHGTIMLLLFATPLFAGFANWIMPLQIGSPDVAFPRLNMLSYWLFLFGGLIVLSGFLTPGGAAAFGWYAYSPLTSALYSPGVGADMWIMGLALSGLGTILGGVNFITTIICMRAPGMTMFRMPIFTWNILVTSILVLMAFPVLAAALLALEADRKFGFHIFDAGQRRRDPLAAPVLVLRPSRGLHRRVALLRDHHRDHAGVQPQADLRLQGPGRRDDRHRGAVDDGVGAPHVRHRRRAAAVLLVHDVPDRRADRGEVLQLDRHDVGGQLTFETPMLWALGFLTTFLFGGLTGIILASPPLDFHVTDSYFVVAHFHYVLFGTVVFAMFGGFYFWWPKFTGKMLDEQLGKVHFWLLFIGFHTTFLVQHWLGVEGHAAPLRRLPAQRRLHHAEHGVDDRRLHPRRCRCSRSSTTCGRRGATASASRSTTRGVTATPSSGRRRAHRRGTTSRRSRGSAPSGPAFDLHHPHAAGRADPRHACRAK